LVEIVKVDEEGRITLPKSFGIRGEKVVVISAGTYLILIPISSETIKATEGWLKTEKEKEELRKIAEEKAFEDATLRARRRKQLRC